MTDRELLEAAATAAGIVLHVWGAKGHENFADMTDGGNHKLWNPLTDDGDALRLAGKLRIHVEHMKTMNNKDFGINCWPAGRGDCGVSEDGDLTDYQATIRRAIVRAAAAMHPEGGM